MSAAVHLDAAWSEAGLDSRAPRGAATSSAASLATTREGPRWAAREKTQLLPPQRHEAL